MSSVTSPAPTKLLEAEKAFKHACDEIIGLNRKLDELSKRYEKASRENRRSFRYSLRLRMAVTEGVRNMFYEFATAKADEITDLRCQVRSDDYEDIDDGYSDEEFSDSVEDYDEEDEENVSASETTEDTTHQTDEQIDETMFPDDESWSEMEEDN